VQSKLQSDSILSKSIRTKQGISSAVVPFWRTQKSQGRRAHVGKYGVSLGDRGVYDERNTLNDLTGREWTYFLNSVWITAYPPVANGHRFDLRKVHPCPKPPLLMRDIIKFFTKGGGWILDPFAGVGGTLIGAAISDVTRNAIGIELERLYIQAYGNVCKQEGFKKYPLVRGDARNLLKFDDVVGHSYDLILTDPPYFDMMKRKKMGHKKKLYGKDDPSPFTTDRRDLSNLNYADFLLTLKDILARAASLLKPKKYVVVFCRDFQPTIEHDHLLHADVIRTIGSIPGLVYKGLRIWYDQAVDLYPFGYPFAFVSNQMHQYILVFRKEK
jgi:DNA methylase